MQGSLTFKRADRADEFEQIAALNYATFVEEIPQHEANASGMLTDKLHAKNSYVIAKDECGLAGMLALNMERPFSLDSKIANLDSLINVPGKILCEIRLLAIRPDCRKGKVLLGLMRQVVVYALDNKVDFILISGTTRQIKMYKSFGFEAFHPLLENGGADFSPMILDVTKPEAQKWKKLDSYLDR